MAIPTILPTFSHKAKRQARKLSTNVRKDSPQREAESPVIVPNNPEPEIDAYECTICKDKLPANEGVFTCAEHFMCDQCVVRAFDLATRDRGMDLFPAQCCRPLQPSIAEHLLTQDLKKQYTSKWLEYHISRVIKVHCASCGVFLPPATFCNADPRYTVAVCACSTHTCVGCKAEMVPDVLHVCNQADDHVKPEWLPEYSADCRIKRFPDCKNFIEHREACNHMTCSCGHQFCFVCMLSWTGSHSGCPIYHDPPAGYDDEGFELTERGLHRDTGLDRNGNDRNGQGQAALRQHPHMFEEGLIALGGGARYDNDDGGGEIRGYVLIGDNLWTVYSADSFMEETARQQGFYVKGGNEIFMGGGDENIVEETPIDIQSEEVLFHTLYPRFPRPQRSPLNENGTRYGGHLAFHIMDCAHSWNTVQPSPISNLCMVCECTLREMRHETCRTCGVMVCIECRVNFNERLGEFMSFAPGVYNMVTPILWAEDGVVPSRRDRYHNHLLWWDT